VEPLQAVGALREPRWRAYSARLDPSIWWGGASRALHKNPTPAVGLWPQPVGALNPRYAAVPCEVKRNVLNIRI